MCFIYIGNVPMAAYRRNLAYTTYDRADLERFLFPIWCTPRVLWILCMTACASFRLYFIQTSRVIFERYSSRYNIAFDALCLLHILLSFYMQSIHFRSKPYEFDHIWHRCSRLL